MSSIDNRKLNIIDSEASFQDIENVSYSKTKKNPIGKGSFLKIQYSLSWTIDKSDYLKVVKVNSNKPSPQYVSDHIPLDKES